MSDSRETLRATVATVSPSASPTEGGTSDVRFGEGLLDQAQGRNAGRGGGDRRGVRPEGAGPGGRNALVSRLPRQRQDRLLAIRRAFRRRRRLRGPHWLGDLRRPDRRQVQEPR